MRQWSRIVAPFLVALMVVVTVSHSVSVSDGDPPVGPRGPAGGLSTATSEDATRRARRADLPRDIETQRQLGELVAWTRGATRADVPALRRAALESKEVVVVANCVRALGRLRRFAGDGKLTGLLDHGSRRVRQEAVRALGASRERSAVPILAELVDGEPELRPLVLESLGRLGGEEARTTVAKWAGDPAADDVTRVFARAALKRIDAR